jgi:hypothetical protein
MANEFPGVKEAKLLTGAGLDMPPIPEDLAGTFVKRSKWCFCSRRLFRRSPYDLFRYVEMWGATKVTDRVLLAHAGHGINSYAMHYYLVRGPLRLFLQVGWGGVYMGERETTEVNRCFGLVGSLLSAADVAVRSRRLRPADTLCVVASDFYGGHVWPPATRRPLSMRELREHKDPDLSASNVLGKAITWCEGSSPSAVEPARLDAEPPRPKQRPSRAPGGRKRTPTEPSWRHADVFPIIARVIEGANRELQRFVTAEEIAKQLLKHAEARNLLQAARERQEEKQSLAWLASNMVAWFSQRITVGESKWKRAFERKKIDGRWAYKPAASASPRRVRS